MLLLVFFLLVFNYQIVIADIQQRYVIINCTWPCPIISDTCVLTNAGAQCQAKSINEWVINTPTKSPVYTGAYSSVENHTCIPAPILSLPAFRNSTPVSKGQTVIQWPIVSNYRTLDEYLGNCNHGMYCASTTSSIEGQQQQQDIHKCKRGFGPGSKCVSSNQCQKGYCYSGTCHQRTTQKNGNGNSSGQKQKTQNEHGKDVAAAARKDKRTVQIVASIVSILGAIGIVICAIVIVKYRRRYRLYRQRQKEEEEANKNNNRNFILINEISDSYSLKNQMQEITTHIGQDVTPSMQQNVLQKELLKNHHQHHHAKPSLYQV